MFIYILMIALVSFSCFLYMKYPYVISRDQSRALIGPDAKKCFRHPMFIMIVIIMLVPFVLRYKVGTDFQSYLWFYENNAALPFKELLEQRDYGYFVLERINTRISKGNWYFHCVVLGVITYSTITRYHARYSNNILYSIFIYMTSMSVFSIYNGTRQNLAISFVILAIMQLLDKKYARAVILFFIASTFHSTVLIVLPLLLLCFVDYKKKWLIVFKGALIISVLTLSSIWSKIVDLLYSVGQNKLADDYGSMDLSGTNGSNILNLAIVSVPVVLVIIFGDRIKDYVESKFGYNSSSSKNINFLFNAVQFAFAFILASQSNWIFARFASFFGFGTSILFTFVYPVIDKRFRSLFCIVSCALYFIYMCLLLPVTSNLLPYRTAWGWYFP